MYRCLLLTVRFPRQALCMTQSCGVFCRSCTLSRRIFRTCAFIFCTRCKFMGDSVGLYCRFVVPAIDWLLPAHLSSILPEYPCETVISGYVPKSRLLSTVLNVPRLRNHGRIQFLCTVRYLRNPIQPDTRQPRSL